MISKSYQDVRIGMRGEESLETHVPRRITWIVVFSEDMCIFLLFFGNFIVTGCVY